MSSQVSLTDFNHIQLRIRMEQESCECIAPTVSSIRVTCISLSLKSLPRFWTELGNVFDKLGEEPAVRVVVLASALDKLFSAGIDCGLHCYAVSSSQY